MTDFAVRVIESEEADGVRIEIVEYGDLSGGDEWRVADRIYALNKTGVRLRQVRITLDEAAITTEAGALHFMHGPIEMKSDIGGVGGLAKKMLTRALTDESVFRPTYRGSGEIWLEPTFGHFAIARLSDERVVADKGMFYCCEPGVDVGVYRNPGMAKHYGGEGWFQTKVEGSGLAVFAVPVPRSEIKIIELYNEQLKVDGNFALLRKGEIEFTVEKSSRGLLSTITGGEGLLQTFRGTGQVWLAPTQAVYKGIARDALGVLSSAKGTSNTQT